MTGARTNRRRAFTIVELMMALAAAGLVVSGALGLFAFLYNAESRLNKSAPQQTRITIAHTVIMRTMGTLAAGVPLTPPEEDLDEDDEDPSDPDEIDLEELELENEDLQNQLAALFGDAVPDETLEEAVALAFAPPPSQIELFYDDRNTGEFFQTLEVSLSASPVQRTRSLLFQEPTDRYGNEIDRDFEESLRGVVRGAFEIIEFNRGQKDYALQWAWLDEPDLEPRILIKNVRNIYWEMLIQSKDPDTGLTIKDWVEIHAAYLAEDFPLACRVQIELEDGSFLDWMFETAVSIPEQPS